mmetsp:Transcript_116998/g.335674  ORF Transcript_116998/g.335674 Transcript_116998/m.335674 type:complete len:201 (+) Transcript_116998:972-1574(+)
MSFDEFSDRLFEAAHQLVAPAVVVVFRARAFARFLVRLRPTLRVDESPDVRRALLHVAEGLRERGLQSIHNSPRCDPLHLGSALLQLAGKVLAKLPVLDQAPGCLLSVHRWSQADSMRHKFERVDSRGVALQVEALGGDELAQCGVILLLDRDLDRRLAAGRSGELGGNAVVGDFPLAPANLAAIAACVVDGERLHDCHC